MQLLLTSVNKRKICKKKKDLQKKMPCQNAPTLYRKLGGDVLQHQGFATLYLFNIAGKKCCSITPSPCQNASAEIVSAFKAFW